MPPSPASIHPTSDAQHAASTARTLPGPELIRPGISAVALPVIRAGNVPCTLCYLLEDSSGSLHVVDPGEDHEGSWDSLVSGLLWLGKSVSDIASVTVTHNHPDHLGMAGRLRRASGAPVGMHVLDRDALRASAHRHGQRDYAEMLRDWGIPAGQQRGFADFTGRPRVSEFNPDVLLEDGN